MKFQTTKKLLTSTFAAALLILQVPIATFAATPEQINQAIQNSVAYLATQQDPVDGHITPSLKGETDWTIVAVEAIGGNATTFKNGDGPSLVDYALAAKPDDENDPTDTGPGLARRIIALAAAGQDTSSYVANFIAIYHDQDNHKVDNPGITTDDHDLMDDIWAVIAAAASGDPALLPMAQDGLNYFLSHQKNDGSFSNSTDCSSWCGSDSSVTAAAIIAMRAGVELGLADNLNEQQAKALTHIMTTQNDGGFGMDAFSPADGITTSWVLMALNAIGPCAQPAADSARDWLLAHQNNDNGFAFGAWGLDHSDTNTTTHAIIALSGKTWLLDAMPETEPAGATCFSDTKKQTTNPVIVTTDSSQNEPQPIKKPQSSAPNNSQVLAVETTDDATDTPTEEAQDGAEAVEEITPISEEAKSSVKYIVYAIIALSLIGFGWYLFRPQKS